MTRDDHRAECLEAMANTIKAMVASHESMTPKEAATRIIDSLHGIAWLVPVEDTRDWDEEKSQPGWNWRRMAASRDLTNPPETKP